MRTALEEHGVSPEDAAEAVGVFHGNIGQCLNFLENMPIREVAGLTKSAINSIINKNEYAFLQAVSQLGKERERTALFLSLFDRTIRDAMVWKYDPRAEGIGCDAPGARKLAERLSSSAGPSHAPGSGQNICCHGGERESASGAGGVLRRLYGRLSA